MTTSGCYLTHLASGQLELLRGRQSIEQLLADPSTAPELRESLDLVQRTRAYGDTLGLAVNGQYSSYVAWPGDRVITSVVAARPGSVETEPFWFPIVGSVPYKGYFDPERAAREAERLAGAGYDVCLVPVRAYSTLGWFDDPVTSPMLAMGRGRLAEVLLHELVHATVFVPSQPEFNEGIATFIGEEASVRFFADAGEAESAAQRRQEVDEARRIDQALLAFRDAVAKLYAETPPGPERQVAREALEAQTRRDLARLPLRTRDPVVLAEGARLNDACLALVATYTADVPRYAARFEAEDRDLVRFLVELQRAAGSPDPRREFLEPIVTP
ncbi:MAG: aminopeptidase [Myxococcota bacterium]|nr:aminopeptidase [Myxococcota bacterium]